MMNLITALISMLVVEPLQTELADRLRGAGAPQAVAAELSNCARAAAPAMIERATTDPWWAASAAFGVWIGTARPGELLVEAAPNCAAAVTAAGPFLAEK